MVAIKRHLKTVARFVMAVAVLTSCSNYVDDTIGELKANKIIISVNSVIYSDVIIKIDVTMSDERNLKISTIPEQLRKKSMFIGLKKIGSVEVMCSIGGESNYYSEYGLFNIAEIVRKDGLEVRSLTDFLTHIDRVDFLVNQLPSEVSKAVEFKFENVSEGSAKEMPIRVAKCYKKIASNAARNLQP
jgi:hypothetical protein